MALIDSTMIKSIVDARIAQQNKTDDERNVEAAVYNSITLEFNDAVTDRIDEYQKRINKLREDTSNDNAEAISFYEEWISKWRKKLI